VPSGLARHEIAVNRFVRGAGMQQAVPSRLVHPYHTVQTLQASWPRVSTERAFLTLLSYWGCPVFLCRAPAACRCVCFIRSMS
jgi:hypothetical protein